MIEEARCCSISINSKDGRGTLVLPLNVPGEIGVLDNDDPVTVPISMPLLEPGTVILSVEVVLPGSATVVVESSMVFKLDVDASSLEGWTIETPEGGTSVSTTSVKTSSLPLMASLSLENLF